MVASYQLSSAKEKEIKYAICVTSKSIPPNAGTTNATEAAQIYCPYTGKNLGAVKVGTGVGIQSMSSSFLSNNSNAAFLAYVGKNPQDMNAALCTLESSNSPKWKCRMPEYMEGGLSVSPCGRFVIGAGRSGHCYCWSTMNNGFLLRKWSAHYRSVTTVIFSDCGFYVITGGADGVVNAWSLLDLSSQEQHGAINQQNASNIRPVGTWSDHQLSISSLCAMPSGRIVSSSSDRQLIIMELFSGKTLARILLPSAIETVTTDKTGHRLYAGGTDGTIYSVDLNIYAVANTAESATVINSNRSTTFTATLRGGSLQTDTILGITSADVETKYTKNYGGKNSYVLELKGHEKKINSLLLLEHEDHDNLLVSASQDGTVRIWDTRASCSARVIRPWSSTAIEPVYTTNQSDARSICPCSCVFVILQDSLGGRNAMASSSNEVFASLSKNHGDSDCDNLTFIRPFQRFPKHQQRGNQQNHDIEFGNVVSLMKPHQIEGNLDMWEITPSNGAVKKRSEFLSLEPKPKKNKISNSHSESNDTIDIIASSSEEEIRKLKKELDDANKIIDRWQKVNNKLIQKLKKIG